MATRSCYSGASKVLGKDAKITKTAVIDRAHTAQEEIRFIKPIKKKCVAYLYIETDEDTIHKQDKTCHHCSW